MMTIVVPSTTRYSDCWSVFTTLFHKFWPKCPYKLVLITDHKTDPWDGDDAIVLGNDYGWCQNFVKGLNKIGSDKILMMQEDFFLNAPVDTEYIEKAIGLLESRNAACFRLYPCPGPNVKIGDDWGLISPGQKYRVSCQSAIWNTEEILEILGNFTTPREFEIDGTNLVNSKHQDCQYLSVWRDDANKWPLQYYCTAIVTGRWDPNAVEFVQKLGIPIDLSRRPIMKVIG